MHKHLQRQLPGDGVELKFTALVLGLAAFLVLLSYIGSSNSPDGTAWSEFTGVALLGLAVPLVAVLGILVLALRDQILTLKRKHRIVLQQFERDALTGVRNRETFLAEAQTALKGRAKRDYAALLLVDIDHFKQVNDTHGHPAGDEVLMFCAKQLRLHFSDALVGRLGGDEFGVLIEHTDPITAAYANGLCTQLIDGLREGVGFGAARLSVSASIGIALAPSHGKTWSSLFANADMALYASKKRGRACSTIFEEDMMSDVRNERALVRELRAAILLRHLNVAYQPIVNGKGELVAYEALLRWHHALRGVIPPDVFIPVAERSSLIAEIGYYVLRQVCRDMPKLPPVLVNVNLSANQIASADLLDRMLEILNETGTDPARIVIEITESASLAASDTNARNLKALQNSGFRIALDDFGMGYSEFNQLRALPFDVIKIDKSYIRALGTDVVTDVFVNAVVEIARRSGKLVVAEGIETEDDRLRALAYGCHGFQGYLFGKPEFLQDLSANPVLSEGVATQVFAKQSAA
ncbi:MAG: EAL domain-containing protein [Hoeflea sp.]|uniref:putative bifunctional diguanylate cyclase/phosphodiesterase n=1 Tax=Hoeflea sp. TaxID=1940281 RepID=UPI002730D660|nr:EAL domain-containing protein [Hoeflea sp.]MDP2118780.1 EAL domain-containing protein [Hoeflea sp.]